jgi:hypothetical protein
MEHTADGPCVKDDCRTPILPPVHEGVAAPACEEPPAQAEILRALSHGPRGVPGIFEEFRDNVQVVTERLVDQVDAPRYFPLIGPAQLHHCHWKCTVHYLDTIECAYPFPFRCTQPRVEVFYIDKDHLHVCAADSSAGAEEQEDHACSDHPCPISTGACEACPKAEVAALVEKYEQACVAGELDSAAHLAVQALAIDPACFSRGHHSGTACTHMKKPIP